MFDVLDGLAANCGALDIYSSCLSDLSHGLGYADECIFMVNENEERVMKFRFVTLGVLTFATVAMTSAMPHKAYACRGFISSILNQCWLDDLHDALGHPLNKVMVPPAPAPAPVLVPPPPPPLGAFCVTPQGVFGPGPLHPVGSPCNVETLHFGSLFGQVV